MLKKLIHALAITAFLTGTAYAQFPMPGLSLQGDTKPKLTPEEQARQDALDNAYNAANKKIPDKKQAADPWGDVRQSTPSNSKGKQQ